MKYVLLLLGPQGVEAAAQLAAHWRPVGGPLAACWRPVGGPLAARWRPVLTFLAGDEIKCHAYVAILVKGRIVCFQCLTT